MMDSLNFSEVERRVEVAISAIRSGQMVLMVDDESRENEGDLVFAAQFATPQLINFMATHARGLICLALNDAMIKNLALPMMTDSNQALHQTAFTVSIEAKHGVTTGISAFDRAHTIQTAIKDGASRADIVVPGHIFPLRAQPGGVLVRTGHTEGSVDLAKLAGLKEAAVICEVLNEDGSMARRSDLEKMAEKFQIPLLTIEDLVLYRRLKDSSYIKEVTRQPFRTKFAGEFELRVFENTLDDVQHMALVLGKERDFLEKPAMVRVQAEDLVADVFGVVESSQKSDLELSMQKISDHGHGVFLYVRHARCESVFSYEVDKVNSENSLRNYGVGAQILRAIGVKDMLLLSDTSKKMVGLQGFGLEVVERVPLHPENTAQPLNDVWVV